LVVVLLGAGARQADLAAAIAGDDTAKALQLGIEYDPRPPFDCGSPDKAPPELVELAGGALFS
jgi:hypothetical protein